MPNWLSNWLERHRHPVSLWLHVIGIPLVIAGVVLAVIYLWAGQWDTWWPAAGAIILGYLLQWVGHHVEGNDMGEIILIKKLLSQPYTAISPQQADQNRAQGAKSNPHTGKGS